MCVSLGSTGKPDLVNAAFAIEQSLEPVELGTVEAREGRFGERAEDEVILLRPAMPAAEQQPPAADIRSR
jgi:hypothetical protein